MTVAALDDLEYDVFNVATGDYATVTEIAEIALSVVGLRPEEVRLEYTGGDRGWKGDVPVVRLNTQKVQRLGWRRHYSSHEALRAAMVSMLDELDAGLL